MLHAVFVILLFQLAGETVQKYFQLAVPGPVIGLILLLGLLLLSHRHAADRISKFRQNLINTSDTLLGHLSLLFVPIGVGVIMHLQLLEDQLAAVLGVIFLGTMMTLIFTAFLFGLIRRKREDGDQEGG